MEKTYSRILCVSDLHIPYHHPDSLAFLKMLKEKLKPDLVVCMGDECDKHGMSFHDSDQDLLSAGDELKASIEILKEFYKVFPEVRVIDSNHGSMIWRKTKHHGIPRKYIKDYNEVLEAPKGWVWSYDLVVKMNNGQDVYFHHGKSADVVKLSKNMGMCAAQGHYHSKFKVEYWANPNGLFWGMQTACLINGKSYAFHYDKTNLDRPIVGTGIILNGVPQLVPMILNEKGRWIGRLGYE